MCDGLDAGAAVCFESKAEIVSDFLGFQPCRQFATRFFENNFSSIQQPSLMSTHNV